MHPWHHDPNLYVSIAAKRIPPTNGIFNSSARPCDTSLARKMEHGVNSPFRSRDLRPDSQTRHFFTCDSFFLAAVQDRTGDKPAISHSRTQCIHFAGPQFANMQKAASSSPPTKLVPFTAPEFMGGKIRNSPGRSAGIPPLLRRKFRCYVRNGCLIRCVAWGLPSRLFHPLGMKISNNTYVNNTHRLLKKFSAEKGSRDMSTE